jgi:cell division transport system permease protein
MRDSPGLFAVCALSVAVAVFLVGGFVWAGLHAARWSEQLFSLSTVVVYFEPQTSEAQVKQTVSVLAHHPGVTQVDVVSPADAERDLRSLLGRDLPPLGDVVGWSAEVRLANGDPLVTSESVASDAAKLPHVDEVEQGALLRAQAATLTRLSRALVVALAALVLVAALFVVYITLSLALLVRRDEIQIQRVVGAGDGFVIVPLLMESACAAVLGAGTALLALRATTRALAERFAGALAGLGLSPPHFLSPHWSLALFATAVFLSGLAALIAAWRHLAAVE